MARPSRMPSWTGNDRAWRDGNEMGCVPGGGVPFRCISSSAVNHTGDDRNRFCKPSPDSAFPVAAWAVGAAAGAGKPGAASAAAATGPASCPPLESVPASALR